MVFVAATWCKQWCAPPVPLLAVCQEWRGWQRPDGLGGGRSRGSHMWDRSWPPSSRFIDVPFSSFLTWIASLTSLRFLLFSRSIIDTLLQFIRWFLFRQCSDIADLNSEVSSVVDLLRVLMVQFFFSHSSLCSLILIWSFRPVSPIYTLSQLRHGTWYTTPHFLSSSILSLGCTSTLRRVRCGCTGVSIPLFLSALCIRSVTQATYGRLTRPRCFLPGLLSCLLFLSARGL